MIRICRQSQKLFYQKHEQEPLVDGYIFLVEGFRHNYFALTKLIRNNSSLNDFSVDSLSDHFTHRVILGNNEAKSGRIRSLIAKLSVSNAKRINRK